MKVMIIYPLLLGLGKPYSLFQKYKRLHYHIYIYTCRHYMESIFLRLFQSQLCGQIRFQQLTWNAWSPMTYFWDGWSPAPPCRPMAWGNLLEIQNQLWLAIFERLQTTNNCHSNFWSAEVSFKICNFAPKMGVIKLSNSLRPATHQRSSAWPWRSTSALPWNARHIRLWEWGDCIHHHLLAQDFLFHWRSCEPPPTNCSFTLHLSWKMWQRAPSKILCTCYLTKS